MMVLYSNELNGMEYKSVNQIKLKLSMFFNVPTYRLLFKRLINLFITNTLASNKTHKSAQINIHRKTKNSTDVLKLLWK